MNGADRCPLCGGHVGSDEAGAYTRGANLALVIAAPKLLALAQRLIAAGQGDDFADDCEGLYDEAVDLVRTATEVAPWPFAAEPPCDYAMDEETARDETARHKET